MRSNFRLLVVAAILYMVYSNVQTLRQEPFAQWESNQWLLSLVTVGLVAAAGISLWRYFADKKREDNEATQKSEQEEAEKREQARAEMDEYDEQVSVHNSMSDEEGRAMERELAQLDGIEDLPNEKIVDMAVQEKQKNDQS